MEEGTKTKRTIFVGGFADDVDEAALVQAFSTFGDIVEVQIPLAQTNPSHTNENKHRGFAFITYISPQDALDAIDNMDLNELQGRVLKVNIARPSKGPVQGLGNRAVWESEDWLKAYAKPSRKNGERTNEEGNGEQEGEGEEAGAEDTAMAE